MAPLTQGMLIEFFGSALYFAVDKYEPDRTVAFMLRVSCCAMGSRSRASLHRSVWLRIFLVRQYTCTKKPRRLGRG